MDYNTLKTKIRQFEERLLNPETRSSPQELRKLLADDFFEFGSSGSVWHLENFTGNEGIDEKPRELSLYEFELHFLEEGAVLATYRVKDSTRQQETLRSSIWKKKEGQWQMFFHQGTPART